MSTLKAEMEHVAGAMAAVLKDHEERICSLESGGDLRSQIERAVGAERVIEFSYRGGAAIRREVTPGDAYRSVPSYRVLSPYEVYEDRLGEPLVRGYDHTREGIRSFRLDRIEGEVIGSEEAYVFPTS